MAETTTIAATPNLNEYRRQIAACRVDKEKGFVDLSAILNHQLNPMLLLKASTEFIMTMITTTPHTTTQSGSDDAATETAAAPPRRVILTAPTSGNALASLFGAATSTDSVILCKVGVPKSWVDNSIPLVQVNVPSRTMNGVERTLVVKKELLAGSAVTIVDDVLGYGTAVCSMIQLCQDAGASVEKVVVFVEKTGEGGRKAVLEKFPGTEIHTMAEVHVGNPK